MVAWPQYTMLEIIHQLYAMHTKLAQQSQQRHMQIHKCAIKQSGGNIRKQERNTSRKQEHKHIHATSNKKHTGKQAANQTIKQVNRSRRQGGRNTSKHISKQTRK